MLATILIFRMTDFWRLQRASSALVLENDHQGYSVHRHKLTFAPHPATSTEDESTLLRLDFHTAIHPPLNYIFLLLSTFIRSSVGNASPTVQPFPQQLGVDSVAVVFASKRKGRWSVQNSLGETESDSTILFDHTKVESRSAVCCRGLTCCQQGAGTAISQLDGTYN